MKKESDDDKNLKNLEEQNSVLNNQIEKLKKQIYVSLYFFHLKNQLI